tara:strand:+ start:298 stop:573 length:276 start_codon:yes stop_codon:yes gene_type:complete
MGREAGRREAEAMPPRTSADELLSTCRNIVMRSCESASIVCPAVPAAPSCSSPERRSITCAVTRFAISGARCWRERSASFASVVATTVARK